MITALIVTGSVIAYLLVGSCIAGLTRRFVREIEWDFHIVVFTAFWPLACFFWGLYVGGDWIATRIDDAITARAERRKGGAA